MTNICFVLAIRVSLNIPTSPQLEPWPKESVEWFVIIKAARSMGQENTRNERLELW